MTILLIFSLCLMTVMPLSNIDNDKDVIVENNDSISIVSLVAVGDNLIHNSVLKSGRINDSTYNFDRLFDVMRDDFQEADIAIINQETILGGDFRPYDGYPNFNSPNELGDAIVKSGFDVVLQASNHTLDVGTQGVLNCIEYWKKQDDITYLGINDSQEERETIRVIERNGIRIALLNYTYGLNGRILPKDKPYLVNLIDTTMIKSDLEKAEILADFTIVFPHWGVEYVYKPNKEQTSLAKMMVRYGADLIIGTHPHVLQPIEWIEASNGNKALCYYSLGNYTSGQKATPRVLGGMAKIELKRINDSVFINNAGVIPLITHYEWVNGTSLHQTYKLSEYTERLEKRHSLNYYDSTFSVKTLKDLSEQIVKEWIVD
ncbi:MAG: CapA family protein [Bacteroidales bacterium]|nr:CapA family protein [Bacteroidales bacterium]